MIESALAAGLQGVQTGIANANQAARDIATATTTPRPGEQQDAPQDVNATITQAAVELKASENQVEASAAVIRTADEVLGTLIDIKA